MQTLLAARAVFFLVLFPGTVTVYFPYRLLRSTGTLLAPTPSLPAILAVIIILLGAALLLSSVWQFFATGRGTLVPIDPPSQLVVTGLYCYTRNPMYNGVVTVLVGEAWLFSSTLLIVYAASILLMFHLFVVLYEERALTKRFGQAYKAYQKAVPRWGFTVHAYSTDHGSTA